MTAPHSFAYEACDIPAGMTIREYRAKRAGARRPSRRVLRRLRNALRARRRFATTRLAERPRQVRHEVRGSSMPQLSRTRSAGTAAAEPSTDWCVIACGTSISDSTPPSDSASVNSLVRARSPSRAGGGS